MFNKSSEPQLAEQLVFVENQAQDSIKPTVKEAARPSSSGPAADRFTKGALQDAVGQQDRRRSCGTNPNRRQSGRGAQTTSSYPQDGVASMDGCKLNPVPTFVGIDVSKSTWDVHVSPQGRRFSVAADENGLPQMLKELGSAGACLIVLEATGGLERRLAAELIDAGLVVAVVNPRQVRDFARALGRLAKTDRIDAETLALFAEKVQPRPTQKRPEKQAELEALVTRRRQLVGLRTMELARQQQCQTKTTRNSIAKLLKVLDRQIADLDKAITKLIESDEDFRSKRQLLQTVPGVGAGTSATLIAELPELGRLNRQEVSSLAGLAPFNQDSGQFRGQRRIRGGRASIRTALYMAALTAKRCNPTLQRFAERLERAGKPFKVVITACMRKLLVILNQLVREGKGWIASPATVHG